MAKEVEETNFEAIVDTACSDIRLPSCIVQTYYAMVPNHIQQDGMHFFPPHQILPDLFLYIGEGRYEVRILGKFLKSLTPVAAPHGKPRKLNVLKVASSEMTTNLRRFSICG